MPSKRKFIFQALILGGCIMNLTQSKKQHCFAAPILVYSRVSIESYSCGHNTHRILRWIPLAYIVILLTRHQKTNQEKINLWNKKNCPFKEKGSCVGRESSVKTLVTTACSPTFSLPHHTCLSQIGASLQVRVTNILKMFETTTWKKKNLKLLAFHEKIGCLIFRDPEISWFIKTNPHIIFRRSSIPLPKIPKTSRRFFHCKKNPSKRRCQLGGCAPMTKEVVG